MKSLLILEKSEKIAEKLVVISYDMTAPLLLLIGKVIANCDVTISENRRFEMSSHVLDRFNVGSHDLCGAQKNHLVRENSHVRPAHVRPSDTLRDQPSHPP